MVWINLFFPPPHNMIILIWIWEFETPVILANLLGGNLLVLVDQHAAHERVRLEQLITGKDLEKIETPLQNLNLYTEGVFLTVTVVSKDELYV